MPIEIRRFGVGNRRPDGPPGTRGVTAQIIHADARGLVAELAFARGGAIEPHINPNTSWFVVIEGGGWVGVGDERTRVAAGEAVHWPADVPHGAWTDYSEMRVIMVEFAGADDAIIGGFLETHAQELPDQAGAVGRGEGSLRDEPWRRPAGDPTSGEPT
jgi:quercetin dioxygenase-like cupin family protein